MALSSFGQDAYNDAMDTLNFTIGPASGADGVDKNSSTSDNDTEQTDAVSSEPEQAATEELDPVEGEHSEDGTPGEPEERSGSDSKESQADVSDSELARLREEKRQLQSEFTRSRQELARLRAALEQERIYQDPQDPDLMAALEADAQRLGFSTTEDFLATKRLLQTERAAQNHEFALQQVDHWEKSQANFEQLLPRVRELATNRSLFATIPRTLTASEQAALMREELEPYYRIAALEHEQKQAGSRAKVEAERKAKQEADRKKAAAKAATSEMAGKSGVRSPQGTPPAEDPGDAIVRSAGSWYSRMLRK